MRWHSCDIACEQAHFPPFKPPQGREDLSRMRVGCCPKTKDGLLDVWTSDADYLKLLVP